MIVETIKESLSVNKLIATKKELVLVEGDMIVPDSKPDILNTICTSGVVCIYKKEVLDGKVRIDGNINTYIMYMADDENDKTRGLNTTLDFSENIQISNINSEMSCKVNSKLKSIEAKVINGRKIGIKAGIEIEIKIYSNEVVSIVNSIPNSEGIQTLQESLSVNSLIGEGDNKIFAKDTININQEDNLVEILKADVIIGNKDVKLSYNKILTKSDAQLKIVYLTEDNRIENIVTSVPVVGFIDIPDVTEDNICDVDYEIRNIVLKPNSVEEHSIYVEIEVEVNATVYEEKQISLIQDLYSPVENLEFKQRRITTMKDKRVDKEILQIRERINLDTTLRSGDDSGMALKRMTVVGAGNTDLLICDRQTWKEYQSRGAFQEWEDFLGESWEQYRDLFQDGQLDLSESPRWESYGLTSYEPVCAAVLQDTDKKEEVCGFLDFFFS